MRKADANRQWDDLVDAAFALDAENPYATDVAEPIVPEPPLKLRAKAIFKAEKKDPHAH